MTNKLMTDHLRRRAIVYVRQPCCRSMPLGGARFGEFALDDSEKTTGYSADQRDGPSLRQRKGGAGSPSRERFRLSMIACPAKECLRESIFSFALAGMGITVR